MSAPSSIAALGSSYAAGPGVPPVEDVAAMRSGANYAHLLAQRLGARLTDLTVSGATTGTILDTPQTAWNGVSIPPQIDGLPADAELVTITAGGNDLGFIGATMSAAARAAGPDSGVAALLAAMARGSAGDAAGDIADGGAAESSDGPSPSGDGTASRGADLAPVLPPVPVPTDDDVERTAAWLARVVDAVRDRAPRARVLLVDYLSPRPRHHAGGRLGQCPGPRRPPHRPGRPRVRLRTRRRTQRRRARRRLRAQQRARPRLRRALGDGPRPDPPRPRRLLPPERRRHAGRRRRARGRARLSRRAPANQYPGP